MLRRPIAWTLGLLALGCGAPDVPRARPSAPSPDRACASIDARGPHSRSVAGAHRACTRGEDCESVRLDCSNARCSAVHGAHARSYPESVACEGYAGPVADYDCHASYGTERVACVEGCCTSVHLDQAAAAAGRATALESCEAVARFYETEGCTTFGPTFEVAQCLRNVAVLRTVRADEDHEDLQAGLDCGRAATTCAALERCVQLVLPEQGARTGPRYHPAGFGLFRSGSPVGGNRWCPIPRRRPERL